MKRTQCSRNQLKTIGKENALEFCLVLIGVIWKA